MNGKILASALAVAAIIIVAVALFATPQNDEYEFQYWSEGSEPLSCLIEYVEDVTNPDSKNFVPENDRIAVFDMDGTLVCETANTYLEYLIFAYRVLDDETFDASEELKQTALMMREIASQGRGIPSDVEDAIYKVLPLPYAGMTTSEYRDYIVEYLDRPALNYDGLTYRDYYYKPMKEVTEYLAKNGFSIYVCSGTERSMVRTIVTELFDIPSDHVIGADMQKYVKGHEGEDSGTVTMDGDDLIVIGSTTMLKNLKAEKAMALEREIGMKPILAFGNSSGDYSMLEYATNGNKYRSQAFFVLADDDVRERPNLEKSAEQKTFIESKGWIGISMKDDFKTIYGPDVMPSDED